MTENSSPAKCSLPREDESRNYERLGILDYLDDLDGFAGVGERETLRFGEFSGAKGTTDASDDSLSAGSRIGCTNERKFAGRGICSNRLAPVLEGQTRVASWLSRARRRCSNVRDWLPKMCSCLEGGPILLGRSGSTRVGSYERLSSESSVLEFVGDPRRTPRGNVGSRTDSSADQNQTTELRFYDDDGTWTSLPIEKKLRAIDVCRLLKLKKGLTGNAWSIVEMWPQLGIERTLEDHEEMSEVHRETRGFASHRERKFFFRMDFLKYDLFLDPKRYFPADMVVFPSIENEGNLAGIEPESERYSQREEIETPRVFGTVWTRTVDPEHWRKTHMLLRDRKLYVSEEDSERLTPFARLSSYTVYRGSNAKKRFGAPYDWAVCLRPSAAGNSGNELKLIVFPSERSRLCWITAMRLAKYGKQLRENYRAFKNKQGEQSVADGPKEGYDGCASSSETVRSRVAMDFTGSVGRIVEDPKEAKDIAESEGVNWRRTWRPFSRPPPGCAMVRLHGLDDGIHVLQPWFHRGLKREVAAAIVRDCSSVDGVFLVRESKSNLGAYVLTYKFNDKVFHAQIQPVFDVRCNCWLYTLDKGVTKFYDLVQLIEFYQLNAGSLPSRLTRYVQNGLPVPTARSVARNRRLMEADDDDDDDDDAVDDDDDDDDDDDVDGDDDEEEEEQDEEVEGEDEVDEDEGKKERGGNQAAESGPNPSRLPREVERIVVRQRPETAGSMSLGNHENLRG